ncbi:DUF3923 family protein [Terribacillus sp. DMT04]|uniref:DUF3923 family protein n=1 Tax=Terribacillus sp. DMT04 TaxID=2850441 RepID=UPI001C2C5905|nr:DUF3923 family protein [Terribacillus sp. DMT04]QXE03240.1 DUF3923 family protein [Terribacillus sp. DMT04]
MKVSWIAWWIINAILLTGIITISVFVWTRSVDAAGIVQTYETRMISFIILTLVFIIPLAVQIIWMIINFVVAKNKKGNTLDLQ